MSKISDKSSITTSFEVIVKHTVDSIIGQRCVKYFKNAGMHFLFSSTPNFIAFGILLKTSRIKKLVYQFFYLIPYAHFINYKVYFRKCTSFQNKIVLELNL